MIYPPATTLDAPARARGSVCAALARCLLVCACAAAPAAAQYRFDTRNTDHGLPNNFVYAIIQTRDGYLWFTTLDGLVRYDGARFTVFNTSNIRDLPSNRLTDLFEDRSGALWFGTHKGLVRYRDGLATVYTTKDGLAGDDVRAILEDRPGRLWIGTYGGLTQIAGGKFSSWTKREGLKSNRVRTLHEDQSGALWVGSYDGGLSRIKDGRIANITMDDGLFNIVYGKSDGMLNPECNGGAQPAGARARDGRLWFPTQHGVAVIDPETVLSNPHPPSVVIEDCLLDRAAVDFSDYARIGPGQRNLEIHYTALSFIKPEHIRFRYKLEGLDAGWVDAGTRRIAYYSYIPPGEYTFTVIAANSDGVWNTEGRSLRIVALPPFYRTWWFMTLASASAIGVTVLLYRGRIAQLKRAHAAQEAFSRRLIESQEGERKRIAAELHDGLGQSLAIIRNRALFGLHASADPDSICEQFEQISEQSSQAIDEVKEISYNLRPYLLDRIGLTKALEAMINKVADSSGLELRFEIGEIDEVFSKEAEINLYRIVQESLNNIVKHAEATEAQVIIKRHDQAVQVIVGDNGKGFAPEALEVKDGNASARRGFGLIGIAERARMLGGDLTVQSAPNRGTIVKRKVSLKDDRQR